MERRIRRFRFVGCRRSGNHAIIEWVARHFKTATLHNDLPTGWNGVPRKSQTIEYENRNSGKGKAIIMSWEDKTVDAPIILRSAYNVAASRFSSPGYLKNSRKMERFLKVWPIHAKKVLEGCEAIVYDQWIAKPKIREAIQDELELPDAKVALQANFPARGRATTFTKFKMEDRLNRWKEVDWSHPDLKAVLENEEIRTLHKEIFQWTLNQSAEKE